MNKDTIKQIKNKMPVVQYARDILGFGIKRAGDRWTSLKPSSNNKSCCVFHDDYFHDFNLQIGGDVIDLCAYAKHNGDKGQAIKELATLCGIPLRQDTGWVKKAQEFGDRCYKWNQELNDKDREYLNVERKITDETISRLKIGSRDDRIIIPIWKNNQIVFYVGRGEDPKYKNCSLDYSPTNELIPYGFNTLYRKKPLIITEGVLDGVIADQEGYQVVASLGGSFNSEMNRKIMSACKAQDEDVILVFDKDENGAGQEFLLNMAKNLFSHNINFYVYEFDRNEDLNDLYIRTGSIDTIVEEKEEGLKYLVSKITDKREFKKFARKASKFVGKAEIAEMFDIAAETTFKDKKSWVKEVKKQAMSCPTEDAITNEVKEKEELIWKKGVGFLEYSSGCWRERPDEEIKGKIGGYFGHYRTSSKCEAVMKLLQAECLTDKEFNKNNYLNFLNGMLNLDTLEIEEHSKEFMSSIQIEYSYDSKAECPRWIKFIKEITEDCPKKYLTLQEMAGYVLFPDNKLQRTFILIGGGSNGKSVFLETLRKVFGEKNCSAIEVSSLMEEFQRILLKDSLLNISTEMTTKLNGAEAIFKNIVAGEEIVGCHKHKPHVTFKPRVKMFFATNSMIKPKDLTYGFIRRLLFIKFNLEYKMEKSEVRYSNQRHANINLLSELEAELPGIFNWALEGYKRLVKNKTFTESEEHSALVQDMKKQMNPAFSFFEQMEKDEYQPSELYAEYKQWCVKGGRHDVGRDEFLYIADDAINTEMRGAFKFYLKRT